ncbi:arsenical resistance operon trans-acting repressor ArsD [Trichococcus patagoniensis]|uniref:Arsenical resistance operon trans-acting repressor ArsD n=1 Tax=Trichococcus patagoniensis TaxID=382641 RepID=A0A2T5IC75_9LACT|nr:arsenic metallochaperone ArsD family protein [Trichococcus patagoniensis]PTQ81436.1 arsenical resistance operon trans-acting repressor ArsD [Trichococcus patagoniensis]
MNIEYYVFDKMNAQSEKVEVAIEIMRSLSMYKDLFKDSNNYFLYSLKHSQEEFKENKDVWNLIETHGVDILPIVCIDKKIYKTKDVLSVEEMGVLTNSGISYQRDDTSP